MIRLLLILVLAEPMIVKHGIYGAFPLPNNYGPSVEVPVVVCYRPRSICMGSGPHNCWTGCCNASQAARFALNIYGMGELPDPDAEIFGEKP